MEGFVSSFVEAEVSGLLIGVRISRGKGTGEVQDGHIPVCLGKIVVGLHAVNEHAVPGIQSNRLAQVFDPALSIIRVEEEKRRVRGYVPNYINVYYTDTMGVPMSAVALILMLTKITDGITDIIMGMIIDRTHTRIGKARPWVIAGGVGLALSMMLLFSCPGGLSTGQKIFFCAAFYLLVNPIFGTMISVACGTLNNLVTADSKGRSVLGVFSAYGTLIPVVLIGLVVPKLLSVMNESQFGYTAVTAVFAGMALLSSVVGALILRETVTERSEANLTQKVPVKETLIDLFTNKYFLLLGVGTILYNLSAVPVLNYYAKYVFGDIKNAALMNLPSMVSIVLLPFAVPFIEKVGKRKAVVTGLLMGAIGGIILFIANTNMPVAMLGRFISGIGTVLMTIALIPMTGEICDYALYKTGKPMDGVITSAATMGGKIGIGLAAGLSGVIMAAAGYIQSTAAETVVQPASAVMSIRLLAGIWPAVLFTLSALCFLKIDMEKEHIGDIQKELREKGLR